MKQLFIISCVFLSAQLCAQNISFHNYSVPNREATIRREKPVYYLRQLAINKRPVNPQFASMLKPAENNISITFGYLSFNGQDITTRYRMGKNDPWRYTKNRTIEFSSLPPEKYFLELEYSTDQLTWYSSGSPLEITIEANWWQRWHLPLAVTLILVAGSFLYVRHRMLTFRKKNNYLKSITEHQQKIIDSEIETLERERNRIAKELHDNVGTNLSAIHLMLNQLLKNRNEPLVRNVEEYFQSAIKEIKDIIFGLTPPGLDRYGLFASLNTYISRLNESLPITITLKVYGNEITTYELNVKIFRILQELLSNSIKYSNAKNAAIHISCFEDLLSVVYEDDGKPSGDMKESALILENIETRIQSLKGTVVYDSGEFGVSYTIDIPINLNTEAI